MEDFTYDITAEDRLAVVLSQRNDMFNQLTAAQVELHKARTIISRLNDEVNAYKNAAKAPVEASTKTKVKKVA